MRYSEFAARLLLGAATAVGAAGALTLPASAQTAVQVIDTVRSDDLESRIAPLDRTEIQFTSQRPPSNADEIRFILNDIVPEGATALDPSALRAVFADDIGQEVALTRIYEIAGEIQGLYRDADYIFTRVVVPAQEIDGGVVRLEVVEAVIEAVTIEEPDGPVGPVRALAERMVARLIGVANPTGAALERALLNINEIPGITRATAVPQVSTSGTRGGLLIFVNIERDWFEGALYADNRQTPGIGRGLFGATAQFNSYSEWGDTTAISWFNSFAYRRFSDENTGVTDGAFDFDERNTLQIEHSRNIGADGLTLHARGIYSKTRPGDDLALIGIDGEQIFGELYLKYPIIRTRELALDAWGGVELFESTTDVSNGAFTVADDRLRIAKVGFEGLLRDSAGYTRADITLRQGLDIFNATEDDALDRSRNDGQSEFTLIRGSIDRLVTINEDLSLFARAGGQYSFDTLLASEEFAIGGTTFGRGYDPSELTGDHGVGVSGELRYLTPFSIQGYAVTMESYGFLEYGYIWNKGDGVPDDGEVFSGGVGVRMFLPEDFTLGIEIAAPLGQPLQRTAPGGGVLDDPRLFVTFSKRL